MPSAGDGAVAEDARASGDGAVSNDGRATPTDAATTPSDGIAPPTVDLGPPPILDPGKDLCAGLVSDTSPHPMTALAKPALLAAVIDPEFKTTIRRITDVGSGVIKPVYSTVPAWNADESRLLLYKVGGGHQLYDGKTYALIKALNISPADLEQVYWHTSDPDILFYVDGKTLIRYHVSSGQKDSVHTFSNCSGSVSGGGDPMYISWDAKVFGLSCGSQTFAYNLGTDTTGASANANLSAQAAPSGTLLFVGGAVHDFQMKLLRTLDLASGYEHASLGRLTSGHDAYVGVQFDPGAKGCKVGTIVVHDMNDGSCWVAVGPATGYPYPPSGTHVSAVAFKRPGWAVASIVGNTSGKGVLDQELVVADINSGGKSCRVAHHRSHGKNGPQGYWAEPHPVMSPSGTRILFASDWGGGPSVDTYVVELPGAPTP